MEESTSPGDQQGRARSYQPPPEQHEGDGTAGARPRVFDEQRDPPSVEHQGDGGGGAGVRPRVFDDQRDRSSGDFEDAECADQRDTHAGMEMSSMALRLSMSGLMTACTSLCTLMAWQRELIDFFFIRPLRPITPADYLPGAAERAAGD